MPENIVRHRLAFTHRGLRLLFALVLGLTVFASMATQQSAHAAVATVNVAHRCESFVAPNGNQAVVCTDINETPGPDVGMEYWGTGEYFCQGFSAQCSGISASNNLKTPDGTFGNRPFTCLTTSCPNGGRAMVSTSHRVVGVGCVFVTATIDSAADILVNGTSTAWHPPTLPVSGTVCAP